MSEDYAEGTCAATVGCQRHATVGLCCRGHFERLGAMLRDIEDEASLLSAVPSMQQRMGSGKGSLASERAPARLDVLVLNDSRRNVLPYETPPTGPACVHCWHETCMLIRNYEDAYNANALENMSVLNTLHAWARIVRAERRFAPGGGITLTGERDLLTRQLDWIAAQPWIDEFYDDLTKLEVQLRSANGHKPDRPYSRCVVDIPEQCPGHIWFQDEMQPVWRRYIDRCAMSWEKAPGPAVCDTCGSTWTTVADKERLKLIVEQRATELDRPRAGDGTPLLTVEQIAAKLGKTENAVRITISRKRIPSVNGHYDLSSFGKDSDSRGDLQPNDLAC